MLYCESQHSRIVMNSDFLAGEPGRENSGTGAGSYWSKVGAIHDSRLIRQTCLAEAKQREAMRKEREADDNERMVRIKHL